MRDLLSQGPHYRERVSYSWHQNFGIIMDAYEEYARPWAKKEHVKVDRYSFVVDCFASPTFLNVEFDSVFSDPVPISMRILS